MRRPRKNEKVGMTRNLRTWLLGTAAIVVAGVVVGPLFLGEPEVAAPAITPAEAKGYFGLLPAVADNPHNPVTPAKVELGKALFFEPRLSKSGFIACASCHHLASGGGDGLATSIGHRWQVGGRNAPTVLNAALHVAQSWDGGAADVEEQAGKPISNPGGMASSETLVLKRLRSIPAYPERFRAAFPDDAEPLSYATLTAPYFHDGSVWTLEEAVQIMADTQLGTKLSLADADSIATFLASPQRRSAAHGDAAPASGIDRHDAASRAQLIEKRSGHVTPKHLRSAVHEVSKPLASRI